MKLEDIEDLLITVSATQHAHALAIAALLNHFPHVAEVLKQATPQMAELSLAMPMNDKQIEVFRSALLTLASTGRQE